MPILKEKQFTIKINQKTIILLSTVLIIAFLAGGLFWVKAAFIEPDFAPSASDQDFAQNILGANSANNEFSSDTVTGNQDGSIIERLEYMVDTYLEPSALINFSLQKNQIYDDWKGSASSTGNDLAYAYANAVDMNKEEGEWASSTDTDMSNNASTTSGVVKRDQRTGLYWSDCYSLDQDGNCDTITNSFTLDGSIADTDDGLDAEGGNAVDFCESLILDADGDGTDETDWYLPSQKELMQAYINGAANNLPNPDHYYWSSTEYYGGAGYAWSVTLYFGYTYNPSKTNPHYARCVRR